MPDTRRVFAGVNGSPGSVHALVQAPPLAAGHVAGPVYKVPARIPAHTALTGGMPGWQITLIAAAVALLAAALALVAHRLRSARRRVSASAA